MNLVLPILDRREKKRAQRRAHYAANRERIRATQKEYRSENVEKIRAAERESYAANPQKYHANHERYYAANREKVLVYKREYSIANREKYRGVRAKQQRDRIRSDPEFRLVRNVRNRVWTTVVRGHKSARTMELLGCTISELRAHLESQFRTGMTWENYGPVWHIDHRRPCASFDLLDPAQQRECFNFKNLQPLFAEENLSKGAK